VDKATMACSLEARVPFLDIKLIELSAKIPCEMKLNKLTGKYILKKALAGVVPTKIINRKKHGFSPPLVKWFQNGVGELALSLFSEAEAPFIDFKKVCDSYPENHKFANQKHANRYWHLLLYELWYRRFIS
jgi:asparagine synthase (glutamine-hydrolysing)